MLKQKRTMSQRVRAAVQIATGIGAIAEVASAYFSGLKGVKRRTAVKSWALKMKGEVLEEIEHLKDLGERKYRDVIDGVAVRYRALQQVDPNELREIVRELKSHWKSISRDVKRAIKSGHKAKKGNAKPRSTKVS